MNITDAMRKWLIEAGASPESTDDELRSKAAEAVASGDLGIDKLAELMATEPTAQGKITSLIDEKVGSAMSPLVNTVKALADKVSEGFGLISQRTDGGEPAPAKSDDAETIRAILKEEVLKMTATATPVAETATGGSNGSSGDGLTPAKLFNGSGSVKVKKVSDQYDQTKMVAICPETKNGRPSLHPYAGQPAMWQGRQLHMPSQLDRAISGAFFKRLINQGWYVNNPIPRGLRMTEHDRKLVEYAAHEMPWTGRLGAFDDDNAAPVEERMLSEMERKALLDESSGSQGQEVVPIVFDEDIIRTPVLFGELFPMVDVVNIDRGRRMESASINTPTVGSGPAEGTADTLESTTAFIAAIDTTIFNAMGSIEIGLDFVEDSPVNIQQELVQGFGDALMEWLDNQIANGDGTTEPTGIFVASGTVSIATANNTTGPLTVGDFEELLFGTAKATRRGRGGRNAYISSDTTYKKARAIAIGSGDERRVFGMTHQDYRLFDTPYKVQNNVSINNLAYGNMGYYRMYRRRGINIRTTQEGQTLILKNTAVVTMRARFGGQPFLASAFAVTTQAPDL